MAKDKEIIIITKPYGTEETEEEIIKILKNSHIKKIAIIDIRCLNQQFVEIKRLTTDCIYTKIFCGGSKEIFKRMIEVSGLEDRKDILYIHKLSVAEIVISYWKYRFS